MRIRLIFCRVAALSAGTEGAGTLAADGDELVIEGGGEWWFNGARQLYIHTYICYSDNVYIIISC